jgi:hypothetical protein
MALHYPGSGYGGMGMYGGGGGGYGSVDHMNGRTLPHAHSLPSHGHHGGVRSAGYLDPVYTQQSQRMYAPQQPASAHPASSGGHYLSSGVPMSAAPAPPFSGSPNGYANGGAGPHSAGPVYAQSPPTPKYYGQQQQGSEAGAGTSTPGSNYGTPQ